MQFDLNSLQLTSKDYWGAEKDQFFEQFYGLPFAPFNKMEKIGKCCDFSQKLQQKIVTLNEEDDDWKDIDVKQKSKFQYKKKQQQQKVLPQKQQYSKQPAQGQTKLQHARQNNRQWFNRTKFSEATFIKTDWENIYEINKTHLDKLFITGKIESTKLFQCGTINEYDNIYDKVKTFNKKPLQIQDKFAKATNTSDYLEKMSRSTSVFNDEYLTKIIAEDDKKDLQNPVVYTTDIIITALMTLKQSNFPFEMEVTKIKNQIIIDKLTDVQNTFLDLQTSIENVTQTDLPENEQDLLKLCLESTIINQNFQKQVCTGAPLALGTGGAEMEDDRNIGFVYKKYTIEKKMDLIIRSEIDAYCQKKDKENSYLMVRTLNEHDLSNDWRKKLETNKGSVFTQEFRNNICKITKWICQAQLSGIEEIKLAYVSRNIAKDDKKHVILEIETHKIQNLIASLNFRMGDQWSIVKFIVELISKQDDGRYVFVKQPWKPSIKIYKCPQEPEVDDDQD